MDLLDLPPAVGDSQETLWWPGEFGSRDVAMDPQPASDTKQDPMKRLEALQRCLNAPPSLNGAHHHGALAQVMYDSHTLPSSPRD